MHTTESPEFEADGTQETLGLQRRLISSLSQHSPDRQAPRSALLLPKSRTASPQVWVQGPPTDSHKEQEHARVQASCRLSPTDVLCTHQSVSMP